MRIRRELLRLVRETAMLDGRHFSMRAFICNTSDSRAWNLLHGPIEQFNSETLIDVLARLGVTINVVVAGPGGRFGTSRASEARGDTWAILRQCITSIGKPAEITLDDGDPFQRGALTHPSYQFL